MNKCNFFVDDSEKKEKVLFCVNARVRSSINGEWPWKAGRRIVRILIDTKNYQEVEFTIMVLTGYLLPAYVSSIMLGTMGMVATAVEGWVVYMY